IGATGSLHRTPFISTKWSSPGDMFNETRTCLQQWLSATSPITNWKCFKRLPHPTGEPKGPEGETRPIKNRISTASNMRKTILLERQEEPYTWVTPSQKRFMAISLPVRWPEI